MIQKIESLGVKLEPVLPGSATRKRRRSSAIATADANHPHLRPASLLLFRSEILAPTHTRTDLPTRRAAGTVSSHTKRTVVDDRVAIVVETGRDVVRQRRGRLEDRGSCETHRQTFTNKARDQVPEVGC